MLEEVWEEEEEVQLTYEDVHSYPGQEEEVGEDKDTDTGAEAAHLQDARHNYQHGWSGRRLPLLFDLPTFITGSFIISNE